MGKLETKNCYICGKEFSFYRREGRGYKYIVCSHECNGKHQKNIGNQPPTYSGNKHPSWKGGRHIHLMHGRTPYWRIVVNKKRVYEHRYLIEQKLGRELRRSEHVHHIDGNSLNNHIDNLEVLSPTEHQLKHHLGRRKI